MKTSTHLLIKAAAAALGLLVGTCAQAQTRYDFEYKVSDSRINVFDDGQTTRLQLPEGLLLPAVIARTPGGEQILTPRRDGVYLVLDGVHAQLALAWSNNRHVHIQYTGPITEARQGRAAAHAAMPVVATSAAAASPVTVAASTPAAQQQALQAAVTSAGQSSAPALQRHQDPPAVAVSAATQTQVIEPVASVQPAVVDSVESVESVEPAKPSVTFAVRQRETVREALARWSQDAEWTHLPEHYTLDFDVQILGSVEPYSDFRDGVRALLATTSMTARPLQPCFYSNQVLRVILRTQRCDQI